MVETQLAVLPWVFALAAALGLLSAGAWKWAETPGNLFLSLGLGVAASLGAGLPVSPASALLLQVVVLGSLAIVYQRCRSLVGFLCAFSALGSFLLGRVPAAPRELPAMTWVHLGTAVCGEGLCVVSLCAGLSYLLDYERLRTGKLPAGAGPSLQALDRLVGRTSALGLALMTICLGTGCFLSPVGPLKVVWGVGVWIYYGAVFVGRWGGLEGRRTALARVWGALLLALMGFGTALGYSPAPAHSGTLESLTREAVGP